MIPIIVYRMRVLTVIPLDSNSTGYTYSILYLSTKYLKKKNKVPNAVIKGAVVLYTITKQNIVITNDPDAPKLKYHFYGFASIKITANAF